MKNWTLRFRAVDEDNFDEVRVGIKSIETRAGTVKYQAVAVGNTLTFVCGSERLVKRVVKKYHWSSVDAMVAEVDFKKIMPHVESVAEMKRAYSSYPDYDLKIKKHGLLGFGLA